MSQRKINIIITFLFTLLLFVVSFDRIVNVNGPATSAVIFRPFSGGIDTRHVYGEGLYFVWPWNTIYKFNTREQLVEDTLFIVVKNGVTIKAAINYRFRPVVDSLPRIFQQFGANYNEVFIRPELATAVREIISDYTPEEIYTDQVERTKAQAIDTAKYILKKGNVILASLMITEIKLPPKVVAAIEKKLQQEQLKQEYSFKIAIADSEKMIKVIEAQAIRMAEDTINSGLTQEYLQFKQIEALQNCTA